MKELRNALPPGTDLDGRYRIDALLGAGGFGIVYRATHIHLDKKYAIKEFLPQEVAVREGMSVQPLSSASVGFYREGLNRFLKEARQLVQFTQHPNIVTCSDYFEANATAYLVMELEYGQVLSDILEFRESKGQEVDQGLLLELIIPLLDGLHFVHAHDVLHRDIKPGNILIRDSDRAPVLLDFGAAKEEFSRRTKSRAAHTPGYAAPEQIEDSGSLGPWTDIYAIGATMYRVMTGKSPPRVETRMRAFMRGQADPAIIGTQNIKSEYSQELLAIVRQCMSMEESNRISDAEQLLSRLKSLPDLLQDSEQKTIFYSPESKLGNAATRSSGTGQRAPSSDQAESVREAKTDEHGAGLSANRGETRLQEIPAKDNQQESTGDHTSERLSESESLANEDFGRPKQVSAKGNKWAKLLWARKRPLVEAGLVALIMALIVSTMQFHNSSLESERLIDSLSKAWVVERTMTAAIALQLGASDDRFHDQIAGAGRYSSSLLDSDGDEEVVRIRQHASYLSDARDRVEFWESLGRYSQSLREYETQRLEFMADIADAITLVSPLQQVSDSLVLALMEHGTNLQSVYFASRQLAVLERIRRSSLELPYAFDSTNFDTIENHLLIFDRILIALRYGDEQLRILAVSDETVDEILLQKESLFIRLRASLERAMEKQESVIQTNLSAAGLVDLIMAE